MLSKMLSSSLFWCLGYLCVIGLDSAIVWNEILVEERQLTTDCIVNSNRLEIINSTPLPIPHNQNTHTQSSRRNRKKGKQSTQPEPNLPHKITPLCQFTIENAPTCRLVVSTYETKEQTSHFFAALVLDGESSYVTRLGSIWSTVDQKRIPLTKDEAKFQAEHYFLWTPHPCKEKWQEVKQRDSRVKLIKVNNENYSLKWFWPVIEDNMVGIYCGPTAGPNPFSKCIFTIGQQLNTANAKLVTTSEPSSLADIEAQIEETLSGVHPFLAKQWLDAEQLKKELGKESAALITLTELAAAEANIATDRMLLHGAKVVTTCKGLICIFKVQPDAGQELSYYVLAGGIYDNYPRFEMTMYINLGNVEAPFEKCDILVKNQFTLAFTPSIMPTGYHCEWPWKNAKNPNEYVVPYEALKKAIADKAPFTANSDEMFVQKIKFEVYDETDYGYKTAPYLIYGYKGRFFTAALQQYNGQWGIVQVSGLIFAGQIGKEISRCHGQLHGKLQSRAFEDIDFAKIFPQILNELPNITGWEKSKIPEDVSRNWIVAHNKIAAPSTPRNAAALTDWYFLLFKITIKNPETLENRGLISYKYFSVVVVNKGEDVVIVETKEKKAWFRADTAGVMFQEFLKTQHDKQAIVNVTGVF